MIIKKIDNMRDIGDIPIFKHCSRSPAIAFAVMATGTAGMEAMSWAGLGLRGELLSEAGQPAVAVE